MQVRQYTEYYYSNSTTPEHRVRYTHRSVTAAMGVTMLLLLEYEKVRNESSRYELQPSL